MSSVDLQPAEDRVGGWSGDFVAVLLAAGEGHRLAPLTRFVPKPLVTVANRPVLGRLLEQLARSGAKKVYVNVHHLGAAVGVALDAEKARVDVEWRVEPKLTGPAGALHTFADVLRDEHEILVQSGDAVHDVDLGTFLDAHRASGAPLSVVVTRVTDPSRYGVARLADDGTIVSFEEKPTMSDDCSAVVSCGIYALNGSLLDRIPRDVVFDFGRHLIPQLVDDGARVYGHLVDDYWNDIGTPATLFQANIDAVTGVAGVCPAGCELTPGIWVDDGTHVEPSVTLRPPIALGRRVVIGPGAELIGPVVIADGATVGAAARVEATVVLEGASVPADTWLYGALVGVTARSVS